MICIYCQGDTKVVNSRHQKRSNSVWRRRQCQNCHTVFTSIEEADLTGSIVVRKPSKPLEPFSRDKLLLSLYDSLRHRKTALEDSRDLTDTVIAQILKQTKDASIDVTVIILITTEILQRFDRVAATHYTAFHPVKSSSSDN